MRLLTICYCHFLFDGLAENVSKSSVLSLESDLALYDKRSEKTSQTQNKDL